MIEAEVLRLLAERMRGHKCVICGGVEFGAAQEPMNLVGEPAAGTLENKLVPFVVTKCVGCGHTLLFALDALGAEAVVLNLNHPTGEN